MFGNKPLSSTDDVAADDVAINTPIDAEDDVDNAEGAVIMMICVGVGEAIVYMVAVLNVIVVLTLGAGAGAGGGTFGGGGGSCPLRTAWNGGGTTLTVAHCCVNQFEVDCKPALVQLWAKQGTP